MKTLVALLTALPALAIAEPIKVAVSILPHAGFVEAIGGEHIELIVLVGDGQDPHSYNPTPRRVTAVANADLWFTSSMPFEKPLVEKLRLTAENLEIVDLTEGLELRSYTGEHGHADHEAEEGHEHHDHGDFDPHIWLSPDLIAAQLITIAVELGNLDPDHADEFEKNADALLAKFAALDEQLLAKLAPLKGTKFYVFHSAFGYFADAYELREEAIEVGGREPSPKQLTQLIEQAKADNVKLILVQPQFTKGGAKKVADAIGAKIVTVDDLSEDVLGTLESLADAVVNSR